MRYLRFGLVVWREIRVEEEQRVLFGVMGLLVDVDVVGVFNVHQGDLLVQILARLLIHDVKRRKRGVVNETALLG